ncbi:MAG: GntR family transcriptional regulator [Candidatus Fimivivens sp.]|nr:GntR family transcriptional regulator [Candidatus Fimivivens sp.]
MPNLVEYPVKKVKRQTLNNYVYENIKHSILNGSIPAGVKLSEVGMGKQLGVSATPVREAFRMLAMEGLVRIDPWKGAMVQNYSEQTALETTQCREALEILSMELFMEKCLPQAIEAMRYMIEQVRSCEDVSEFVATSSAIHDIWIQGCGNTRLEGLLSQLNEVLLRERNISANDVKRRGEIVREHEDILDALKRKDRDAACAALRRHIRNGYDYGRARDIKA